MNSTVTTIDVLYGRNHWRIGIHYTKPNHRKALHLSNIQILTLLLLALWARAFLSLSPGDIIHWCRKSGMEGGGRTRCHKCDGSLLLINPPPTPVSPLNLTPNNDMNMIINSSTKFDVNHDQSVTRGPFMATGIGQLDTN